MTIKSKSGQVTLEAILLSLLFLGIVSMVAATFSKKRVLYTMVGSPWDIVRGMIESGIWAPSQQASTKHPNYQERHGTRMGDRK